MEQTTTTITTPGSFSYNPKNITSSKPFINEKKELVEKKTCAVWGLELKEENGEYFVGGLIATTHTDSAKDRLPKVTLDTWASDINSQNPQANKASYHHDRQPQVVGKAMPTAKVMELPGNHYGLWVETKLNRAHELFDTIIYELKEGFLDAFSIEYDSHDSKTAHFEFEDAEQIRVLGPKTELHGYGFASRPVNKEAKISSFGFKELLKKIKEEKTMPEAKEKEVKEEPGQEKPAEPEKQDPQPSQEEGAQEEKSEDIEMKEYKEFLKHKEQVAAEAKEQKEVEKMKSIAVEAVKELNKMQVEEKPLKQEAKKVEEKEVRLEVKEFKEILTNSANISLKEQFKRAAAMHNMIDPDFTKTTSKAESREYKSFAVGGNRGQNLEYKSLGVTTNQNTDTDYLQSSAELQDVYDPVIYNALNQETVTWNILAKDNLSMKGNNKVQFTLKTATNASAGFYSGNAVTTGNVTRLKYETKFKKLQVGVSVDGDMIAAAKGGPIGDVFAQEVEDSTMDMLATLNAALFAEVGAETASGIIGFEYIADSAGNTSLYGLTRSAANKLAPDSAGDTYINQGSTVISMTNLRAAIRQARNEGSNRRNLVFITSPTQADMYRGKWDDSLRHEPRDTIFGFSTDIFVDGVPVFEDTDCNTDDWFLVDLDAHRVGIWVPPTIERLGKTADSEDAFIKMYLATYNRRPRSLVQIYGCATS